MKNIGKVFNTITVTGTINSKKNSRGYIYTGLCTCGHTDEYNSLFNNMRCKLCKKSFKKTLTVIGVKIKKWICIEDDEPENRTSKVTLLCQVCNVTQKFSRYYFKNYREGTLQCITCIENLKRKEIQRIEYLKKNPEASIVDMEDEEFLKIYIRHKVSKGEFKVSK